MKSNKRNIKQIKLYPVHVVLERAPSIFGKSFQTINFLPYLVCKVLISIELVAGHVIKY